jgi:ferritin
MLTPSMQSALNAQLNAEYYSSYLYLSMAAYCEEINLKGFANWFRVQVQEEMMHTMKFFEFIISRRGKVELTAIGGPPVKWEHPLAIFEASFEHEKGVSQRINKLADLAVKESDHATHAFLEWFLTEQVEEEASVDQVVQQLRLNNNNPAGLFMLDRELSQRTFTAPAAAAT